MKKVTIYTDGACSGNPGPGGWGAILMYKDTKKEISGYNPETTNNQMELTAVIEAFKALNALNEDIENCYQIKNIILTPNCCAVCCVKLLFFCFA